MKDAILARKMTPDILMVFSSMISMGHPLDDKGNTAMMLALVTDQYELVTLLLERGYSPNIQNSDGYSVFVLIEETLSEFERCNFLDFDNDSGIYEDLHRTMLDNYFSRPSAIPRTWGYPVKHDKRILGDEAANKVEELRTCLRDQTKKTQEAEKRVKELDGECDRLEKEISIYHTLCVDMEMEKLFETKELREKNDGYNKLIVNLHEGLSESDKKNSQYSMENLVLREITEDKTLQVKDLQIKNQELVRVVNVCREKIQQNGCDDLKSENRSLVKTLEGLSAQHETLTSNYNQVTKRYRELQTFYDGLLNIHPDVPTKASHKKVLSYLCRLDQHHKTSLDRLRQLEKLVRVIETQLTEKQLNSVIEQVFD